MIERKPLKFKRKKMNKRGDFGMMLFFFIVIAVVLVVGLFLAISTGVITIFMDEFVPVIEGIGTVGDSTNLTEYSGYALTPVETFVNSLSWMGGVVYLVAFFGLFGLAIGFRVTMNKWLIGLYVLMALLLIIMSIYISNIYEDLYGDTSDFGENIRSQKLLSFLILNCPMILTIIIFASGVVLFAGLEDGGGGI